MSRRVLATVGGAVVVVLLTAGGFWYFVLRADAPPPADLSALDQELAAESADGGGETGEGREGLDGTWEVVASDEGFAGYRIDELYGGATVKNTVVGRTGDVASLPSEWDCVPGEG